MNNKKEFRDFYFKIRKTISSDEKTEFDKRIFSQFINSYFFKNSDIFLVYISVNNEVGTHDLIDYLIENQKKVAVPYCHENIMDFYCINSTDELVCGKFGIPTVDISKSVKMEDFNNAVCIVPAVSFDNNGNRLGYGGGYYDRFLAKNNVVTIGFCYERCLSDNIPVEETDIRINYILTENKLGTIK